MHLSRHRFHHEKRKREIERGGEVALYNRNYWKLNTVALVRESGVTRDFLLLESFFHNIVNLSFKGYPEIEFSSRGLSFQKKKKLKNTIFIFSLQFYLFNKISKRYISSYISRNYF